MLKQENIVSSTALARPTGTPINKDRPPVEMFGMNDYTLELRYDRADSEPAKCGVGLKAVCPQSAGRDYVRVRPAAQPQRPKEIPNGDESRPIRKDGALWETDRRRPRHLHKV